MAALLTPRKSDKELTATATRSRVHSRFVQQDEPTPRQLPERTGKHFCVKCRADVPAEEYFRNDFVCDKCAEEEEPEEQREPHRGHP